jgi:hypothetical protein
LKPPVPRLPGKFISTAHFKPGILILKIRKPFGNVWLEIQCPPKRIKDFVQRTENQKELPDSLIFALDSARSKVVKIDEL